MMVTRRARQLLALRKRKRKDSLFNPNLQELENISTILQENKGKAARKKLYQGIAVFDILCGYFTS